MGPQYGDVLVNATETPLLSLEQIVDNLQIGYFCSIVSKDIQSMTWQLWVGTLLTVVSQALMAVALHGEKERVGVHELHENEREEYDTDGEYSQRDVRFMSEDDLSSYRQHLATTRWPQAD